MYNFVYSVLTSFYRILMYIHLLKLNLLTSYLLYLIVLVKLFLQTCLLECRASEIWAGSWDQAIYIIENQTQVSCSHVLPGHIEGVVDMTLSTDARCKFFY